MSCVIAKRIASLSRSAQAAIVLLGLSLASMTILGVAFTRAQLHRRADFDEAQYLHGSWLLSQNKRLYRDFAEDHTPFLPAFLRVVRPQKTNPDFPRLDVPVF